MQRHFVRTRPTIGFFLSKLEYEYQQMIWQGLRESARELDVNLVCFPGDVINKRDEYEYQANIIYSTAGPDNCDGIIILTNTISQCIDQDELVRFCLSYRPLPVVSIGLNLPGIKSIITDNNMGLRELIRHLITEHSCRRIAFIKGPERHQEAEQRFLTFREVCASFDIPIEPESIVHGDFLKSSGERAIARLLNGNKTRPDAIIASNDWMAIGATETLVRMGLRVPEDIIVAGFDDIQESEYHTPPLSTVHQPVAQLGAVGLRAILDLLNDECDMDPVVLPTRAVIRQSCGCLPQIEPHETVIKVPRREKSFGESLGEWKTGIIDRCANKDDSGTYGRAAEKEFADGLSDFLGSFCTDLGRDGSETCLAVLNGILRRSIFSNNDVRRWNHVVAIVRFHTLAYSLRHDETDRAEGLLEKARWLVSDTTIRFHAYRRMKVEQWSNWLRAVGNSLITVFDVKKLLLVVGNALRELGVGYCSCALYARNGGAPRTVRLLFSFDGSEMIEPDRIVEFPAALLVPEEHSLFETRREIIVEPLYFQDEQLGFLVFTAEPDEPFIYDTLRQQVSNALKGASLVEEITRHADTLEEEVAKRTQELLSVNRMLETEITLRKKVEENLIASEKNLRAIIDAIPIPLVIIRPSDGRIHYANTPFIQSFGIEHAKNGPHSVFEFFHRLDLDPIMEKIGMLHELSHIELPARKRDGTSFWVISSFRKMEFMQEDSIIAGFYDLTERRRLEQEILDVGANERRKIGQELHDDICQNMVGIAAIGHVIENQLSQSDPERAKKAAYLNQLINMTLVKTRALSEGLYPAGLESSGLRLMLGQLAKNVELQFNVRCTVAGDETDGVDEAASLHLYRIAQEAVNNAVRHGNPEEIVISLDQSHGKVELVVRDNGVGVPDDVERSLGLGIKSMRYRAHMIGGKFSIRKNGAHGTEVRCSASLEGEEK